MINTLEIRWVILKNVEEDDVVEVDGHHMVYIFN